jgi:hypothetical protein
MKKSLKSHFVGILAVLVSFGASALAQTELRGTWTAEAKEKHPGEIQLNLYRSARSQMGHSVVIKDLQGLEEASIHGTNVSVRFQLVRDAGTVKFEGTFNKDLGHGEFNFTANQDYLSSMKQMGYGEVERKAFELAMIDVSRAYAKELQDLGFKVSIDKLIEARIFNVNREQVNGLKSVGITDLPIDKLVEYRIFNVTPEYVRQMRASFPNLSDDKMVEMQIHKATPEFAREMAKLGYKDLSADDLVAFRIHGVTPEFIREVGELGFKNLSAQRLVDFRIFGVNADQIRELAKEGYTNLSAQQLVDFKIHHVDAAFIEKVKKHGYKHPTPDELVEYKILGIRVREAEL